MYLVFSLPQNPLDMVRKNWLIERLAEMDLSPDPVKIKAIFTATINEDSLISDILMHRPIHTHPDNTVDPDYQKKGAKVVKVYKKAMDVFLNAAHDETIPEGNRKNFSEEAEKFRKYKTFFEKSFGLAPFRDTKVGWVSIKQTLTVQSYLLFELIKPLVTAYNEGGKEITDSCIHVFIAEFLAAVYREHLLTDELVPAKIKEMIKDIRTTSSKKKLATLHRIIK